MHVNRNNFSVLLVFITGLWMAGGCKEEPKLPPASQAASDPPFEPDASKFANVTGDISLTIPNLVFVVEVDKADPAFLTVTLASSQPAIDGSRLLFESLEHASSPADLKAKGVDFSSAGKHLSPLGNGIFCKTVAYQPKFVSMQLTDTSDSEVTGKLSGEFYKFHRGGLPAKAEIVKLDIEFTAALIRR